ncbi:12301_t:CDS:2 [Dentiscutata heterogama]|uniref:12301_t:CDS:1 n=1 Tax=Dentiscutata heterogama TaxID=1316150 RepID=A0ACA9KZQ9_9GLOM|nr:12301_t:CDS:2 [Dentiscutata heterogama]
MAVTKSRGIYLSRDHDPDPSNDGISDGKYEIIVNDYLRVLDRKAVLPLLSLLLARRKSSFVDDSPGGQPGWISNEYSSDRC